MTTISPQGLPTFTRGASAERLTRDPGCVITLLAEAGAGAPAGLTANRSTFRTGADGAPPHVHDHMSELFYVLNGALQALVGDEVIMLEAGDLLVVPSGVPHAFAAPRGREADVLFVFAPGRERFDYYRLLDRAHAGEATWGEVAASGERFDNRYVDSPAWAAARAAAAA